MLPLSRGRDTLRTLNQVLLLFCAFRVATEPTFSVYDLPGGVWFSYAWSFAIIVTVVLFLVVRWRNGRESSLIAPLYLMEAVIVFAYAVPGLVRSLQVFHVAPVNPARVFTLMLSIFIFSEYLRLREESRRVSELREIEEEIGRTRRYGS